MHSWEAFDLVLMNAENYELLEPRQSVRSKKRYHLRIGKCIIIGGGWLGFICGGGGRLSIWPLGEFGMRSRPGGKPGGGGNGWKELSKKGCGMEPIGGGCGGPGRFPFDFLLLLFFLRSLNEFGSWPRFGDGI